MYVISALQEAEAREFKFEIILATYETEPRAVQAWWGVSLEPAAAWKADREAAWTQKVRASLGSQVKSLSLQTKQKFVYEFGILIG